MVGTGTVPILYTQQQQQQQQQRAAESSSRQGHIIASYICQGKYPNNISPKIYVPTDVSRCADSNDPATMSSQTV